MCLIVLAHRVHPGYPLVLAANRDEFHARPTAPAAFWEDAPHVLAGRDLRAGGTWMGVACSGRWAALTNVRDPADSGVTGSSRGHLVSSFLLGDLPPADYVAAVAGGMQGYSGFNLLVGDGGEVHYVGNRGGEPRELPPGVYGISNHLLDTPWPKVTLAKRALAAEVDSGRPAPDPERLLSMLADADPAPEAELPDTGVGREWERVLSSPFIVSPTYGTRASTVLLVSAEDEATFVERSFAPGPTPVGEVRHRFRLKGGGGG
jgi:uncharacterized protein with NRDE domain